MTLTVLLSEAKVKRSRASPEGRLLLDRLDHLELGLHAELQVVGPRAEQGVVAGPPQLHGPGRTGAGVDVGADRGEAVRPPHDDVVDVLAVVADVELDQARGDRAAVGRDVELALRDADRGGLDLRLEGEGGRRGDG